MPNRHIDRPARRVVKQGAVLSIPEDSELLEVMRWLLAGTCSFLREAGYSQEQLSRELLQLERDASFAPSVQRLMARRAQQFSAVERLLGQWCEDVPFVHPESGAPRSLPLEEAGGASVGALLELHFPKLSQDQGLACLEQHGAIVRQADGNYFPVQRHSPQALLELVTLRSCRYLQTGLRNMRSREVAQCYPDQATVTSRLPASRLGEFLAMSRTQLSFMIGTIELWLMDNHSEDEEVDCALVGAHGYVSVEPDIPSNGTRRGRKSGVKRRGPR